MKQLGVHTWSVERQADGGCRRFQSRIFNPENLLFATHDPRIPGEIKIWMFVAHSCPTWFGSAPQIGGSSFGAMLCSDKRNGRRGRRLNDVALRRISTSSLVRHNTDQKERRIRPSIRFCKPCKPDNLDQLDGCNHTNQPARQKHR
jgi:hypothetical protein